MESGDHEHDHLEEWAAERDADKASQLAIREALKQGEEGTCSATVEDEADIGTTVREVASREPNEGVASKANEEARSRKATKADDNEGVASKANEEARSRKATKADDASVPTYLWTEHFLENEIGARLSAHLDSTGLVLFLTGRMEVMRKGVLHYWKRKTRREFLSWYHKRTRRETGSNGYSVGGFLHCGLLKVTSEVGLCNDLVYEGGSGKFHWKGADAQKRFRRWSHLLGGSWMKDKEAGKEILLHVHGATWWEWNAGSTLFYWRWPKEYWREARDGVRFALTGKEPRYLRGQPTVKEERTKEMIAKKLGKVRSRGYMGPGEVRSLTSFFAVPKGEDDIRMVYDGTKSGLNEVLWAPRFGLPTVKTLLRSLDFGFWMSDVDIGEMFLNYPLHRTLQPLVGVDLTPFFPEEVRSSGKTYLYETWKRAAMGLRTSPYQAAQGMGFIEEVIRGDRNDPGNVFRWDRVIMNLPGTIDYDPSKPWLYKWRDEEGAIAADLVVYVDDIRPSGKDRREAWEAARRVGSVLNWFGSQDAPRKRRDSSQTPGAWTGAVVWTNEGQIRLLVSQDKWDKTKACVEELDADLDVSRNPEGWLSRKRLEQIRGFLNFVFQVYNNLRPHLVGFHLTIDGWRPGRDDEGWRMQASSMRYDLEPKMEEEAPKLVKAMPRLYEDVRALKLLCAREAPPVRKIRCSKAISGFYGFGDASQPGYGASIQLGDRIWYQYGQWCQEEEELSSNWRELANLVRTLKVVCEKESLEGAELFLFTDNATAEACWWKGTSKSKRLFDLILEMRDVELEYSLQIHVIHVSGKRMIQQGTDGLSRGDHSSGVMRGQGMLDFIPLHLGALDRSGTMLEWLDGFQFGTNEEYSLRVLEPEGWFEDGHGEGHFVWAPPPAAADVVVEQLAKAICKRPQSLHVVLVPRLMTGRWRRHLTRGTHAYFKLPWTDIWDIDSQFEPLLCFIALPYRPWRGLGQEYQGLLEEYLGGVPRTALSETSSLLGRARLCQLFTRSRELCPL